MLFTIIGMQIKTTIRCHYTPTRITKIKKRKKKENSGHTKCLGEMQGNWNFQTLVVGIFSISYKPMQGKYHTAQQLHFGHLPQRNRNILIQKPLNELL